MNAQTGKVCVVTGASRGFGHDIALELARRGHQVVATMRNPKAFAPLRDAAPNLDFERLDVNDTGNVRAALGSIEARYGRIDVLINNAGYGLYGPVEDFSEEEILAQFNTNMLGMWRTATTVLPGMRERGEGFIINVTSGGARLGLPLMGMYCASKAAVEQWSEALAYEVKKFGVKIAVVEPGAYRTAWQTDSLRVAERTESGDSPYSAAVKAALENFREHSVDMPPPDELGRGVADLVENPNPVFMNLIGPGDMAEQMPKIMAHPYEQRLVEMQELAPAFYPQL